MKYIIILVWIYVIWKVIIPLTLYYTVRPLLNFLNNKLSKTDLDAFPEKLYALRMAYPIAWEGVSDELANEDRTSYIDSLIEDLRLGLIIQFDLNSNDTDDALAEKFNKMAQEEWYKWDLECLKPDENWHDAMAFACGRTAFALRAGYIVGWLDQETQWNLAILNAKRAQACFDSWVDFGKAWSRARASWIAHSRSDSMGKQFSEEDVDEWMEDDFYHPWLNLDWNTPLETRPAT